MRESDGSVLEQTELDLMRLLGANPKLSQREVAASLDMSLGMVNYCLRALIAKGLVKVENYRNSSNKSAYFYLVTPSGVARKAELTRQFLARRVREYNALRLEIEQLKREQRECDVNLSLALPDAGAQGTNSARRIPAPERARRRA